MRDNRNFHEMQEDEVSCGPATVRMLASALLARDGRATGLTQFQVRHMMGTDEMVGTTETQMATGLDAYGIRWERSVHGPDGVECLDLVAGSIAGGDMVLVRAMKDGYRHWVLASGLDGPDGFVVLDPEETGPATWSRARLAEAMAPRGFEHWTVPGDSPCRALAISHTDGKGRDVADAADIARAAFGSHMPADFDFVEYLSGGVDWDLSVALRDGDEMLGAYLLAGRSPEEALEEEGIDPAMAAPVRDAFGDQHGVEGIALVVREDLRGLGYGRLLRAMPGELGFDYAHGLQLESLGNIDHWRKVRGVATLVAPGMWQSAGKVAPLGPLGISPDSTALDAEYPAAGPRP